LRAAASEGLDRINRFFIAGIYRVDRADFASGGQRGFPLIHGEDFAAHRRDLDTAALGPPPSSSGSSGPSLDGELRPGTDVEALGDHFAALLHGLSVQARDGVPKKRLLALIRPAMQPLLDAAA
jgi:hypothetical protein